MADFYDPDVAYPCQSGCVVALDDIQTVELRFVTTTGALIAIGLTGSVFAQLRDKIDGLLEENPDIADWRGASPH